MATEKRPLSDGERMLGVRIVYDFHLMPPRPKAVGLLAELAETGVLPLLIAAAFAILWIVVLL